MTSIYDRPVRELVHSALDEMADPFTSQDMGQWFAERYGGLSQKTVRSNLRRACVNTREAAQAHWRREERTVYCIADGQFERYSLEKHGPVGW